MIVNEAAEALDRKPHVGPDVIASKRTMFPDGGVVVYRGSISAIPQGLATAERRAGRARVLDSRGRAPTWRPELQSQGR
jgi:hypothetical protein